VVIDILEFAAHTHSFFLSLALAISSVAYLRDALGLGLGSFLNAVVDGN